MRGGGRPALGLSRVVEKRKRGKARAYVRLFESREEKEGRLDRRLFVCHVLVFCLFLGWGGRLRALG